nr:radical SAM protein [Oscillospiraceae bacterium]
MMPRNRILPVFIPHLGCPHHCVFCNQNEITGTVAAKALAELERYCTSPDAADSELALYGGSFTALPVPVQLCYLETARGQFRSIRLSTRPDAIDEETLRRLRDYGVGTIELGAQSMRDKVLLASGRGHSAEDVRQASRMIHSAGFRLVLQMMTGLPGDDDDGAVFTAEELIRLQPDA